MECFQAKSHKSFWYNYFDVFLPKFGNDTLFHKKMKKFFCFPQNSKKWLRHFFIRVTISLLDGFLYNEPRWPTNWKLSTKLQARSLLDASYPTLSHCSLMRPNFPPLKIIEKHQALSSFGRALHPHLFYSFTLLLNCTSECRSVRSNAATTILL